MFRMPSQFEVLAMMARGYRVVSILIGERELAEMYVDQYEPYEIRDSLSFTIHDLQHLVFAAAFDFCRSDFRRALSICSRLGYSLSSTRRFLRKMPPGMHQCTLDAAIRVFPPMSTMQCPI